MVVVVVMVMPNFRSVLIKIYSAIDAKKKTKNKQTNYTASEDGLNSECWRLKKQQKAPRPSVHRFHRVTRSKS